MNKTTNTSTCFDPLTLTTVRIAVMSAYCFIFVVSAIGNGFVGLIVYKIKTMRKPINYFIVNMAISDLLFLISAGIEIILGFEPNLWIFRGSSADAMCKIKDLLPSFSVAVSIQSLVLISVERFEAVVLPLRSPIISLSRCLVFIIATWVVAAAINLPKCLAVRFIEYPEHFKCELRWNQMFGKLSSHANYLLAKSVVLFYCPAILISVLYSIIICKLKSQSTPGENSLQAEQKRIKRNKNVVKMSIAIIVGFFLCWIPWSIHSLLIEFNIYSGCNVSFSWVTDGIMVLLTSAVNPCNCFMFSSNFRMGLKKIHFAKCFRETSA